MTRYNGSYNHQIDKNELRANNNVNGISAITYASKEISLTITAATINDNAYVIERMIETKASDNVLLQGLKMVPKDSGTSSHPMSIGIKVISPKLDVIKQSRKT